MVPAERFWVQIPTIPCGKNPKDNQYRLPFGYAFSNTQSNKCVLYKFCAAKQSPCVCSVQPLPAFICFLRIVYIQLETERVSFFANASFLFFSSFETITCNRIELSPSGIVTSLFSIVTTSFLNFSAKIYIIVKVTSLIVTMCTVK